MQFIPWINEKSEFPTFHNRQHRSPDNLHVAPERARCQILQIHVQTREHLLHGVGIAVVERSLRRQPRAYLVELGVIGVMLHNLVDENLSFRAVADERHIATEYVPELWELVQMIVAEEVADRCHLRQTLLLGTGDAVLLGILMHGAELQDVEWTSMEADTLLTIDRLTAMEKDDQPNDHKERRQQYEH